MSIQPNQDIRWVQRLDSFNRALTRLEEGFGELTEEQIYDDHLSLAEEGIIQRFEFTYELALNLLADYIQFTGEERPNGKKETIRTAFKLNLITEGDIWMDMIKDRNITSHQYDEQVAIGVLISTYNIYINVFSDLRRLMTGKWNKLNQLPLE
jgi:nucleotidyltransferase substrate binding protein (TIGR01987 family)